MKTPITSLLRNTRTAVCALFCASSIVARAVPPAEIGTPRDDGKEVTATAPPAAHSPWTYDISVPAWLADTAGTMGVNNVHSHIYTPMDYDVRHFDMTFSLGLEVRYNHRWGFYSDVLYAKLSQAVFPNSLVSKADIHVDQWLADFELNYRLLEGPKGYLDVRAGVRYQDIYDKIVVNANNKAIDRAAREFVDDASAKVTDRLASLNIESRLETILTELIRRRLLDRISGLQLDRPSAPIPPIAGGPLSKSAIAEARRAGFKTSGQDAVTIDLENAIRAKVAPELTELEAQLKARLAAATADLKAAAQTRIDALKRKIASDIARTVKGRLNTTASLNNRWLDPYVGFAGRYNLDKVFYLTGKTDIGGFGIGSEITWQAYIGLGCQVTHSIYAEAGYRYLYTDYNHDGFLYDITQSGAQIVVGLRF